MADLHLHDHGGAVASGPAAGWEVTERERNGEVWLASTPIDAAPPDAAGDGGGGAGRPGSPGAGPADGHEARARLLRALADRAIDAGATAVHWETDDAEPTADAIAAGAGLTVRRDILQLRRPLPVDGAAREGVRPVPVRALRPGTADEEAWVRCNNRAFASHPDQGRESVESLRRQMAEPWFDPAGFLVLDGDPPVEDGGELDGFCWTKVHPASAGEPARGEIYVIGVDPRAGGRGLGAALVVAGLDHLAARGLTEALLFVDADNVPARRLYDRLGFTTHSVRRVRSRTAGADGAQTTS